MSMDHDETDDWTYDAFRVGRVTRTVEVPGEDGTDTIEEGTIRFEPINEEDQWMWEEEEWVDRVIDPTTDDMFDGLTIIPHEKVGILEFPEPMTDVEAGEWLEDVPERWRQFCDETLECDVRAEDILEEVR